ncbi:MAG: ROK family protein, partial [Malacoplasma sp.]|nr:ROK family protein [Malacoplasma sp.]
MNKEIYLCFDIGATSTKVALIDKKTLEILERDSFLTKLNNKFNLENLKNLIYKKINNVLKKYKILGIGIASTGSVNMDTGEIIYTNDQMLGYAGTNWKKLISNEYSIETIVLNDVKAAGIAEFSIRKAKSGVLVTLGSGFAATIFINNNLYKGVNFSAGEIGQMVWPYDNNETVDTACSVVIATNKIRTLINDDSFRLSEDVKILNNDEAKKIKSQLMFNIAEIFKIINYFYDPEIFIVGGGISKYPKTLEEIIKNLPKNFKKIELAKYFNDAAFYGLS